MKPLKWVYFKYNVNSPEVLNLVEATGVPLLVAVVAANRGIDKAEHLNAFINCEMELLHSPFLFEGIGKAVHRIKQAIINKEKICIYGDYDVDGITSTALMVSYLKKCGAVCMYYIPERIDEGYGINMGAIEHLHKEKVGLIISVDSGITAVDEAKYARELGVDLIITDHHRCKEILPECVAIINPQITDCEYPFKSLAGVGVAFKLICALEDNTEEIFNIYSEIVALGTIADIVSLTDENRAIVSHGLSSMSSTKNEGIKALLEIAGLTGKQVSVGNVGFAIAPRINAAGRIGDPEVAVNLLLTDNCDDAKEIALRLDNENKDRQHTEALIFKEVLDIIESNPDYTDKKVIVLSGEGWHHGVIGIVASRVCERYYRPCILIACENGVGKGSGRSVKGFNLFEALGACAGLLGKFGGHELAAGLSLNCENLKEFDNAINKYADENLDRDCLIPKLNIDCEVSAEYLNVESAKSLSMLEPFGMGNPQPVFSVCGLEILAVRTLSEGKHIRFEVQKDSIKFDVIGFGRGELAEKYIVGDIVNLAGILSVNEWNGQTKLQMMLKDIALKCENITDISPVPTRDDLVAIYTYIKKNGNDCCVSLEIGIFARVVSYNSDVKFNEQKLLNCLEIFAELRLATYTLTERRVDVYLIDCKGKKVNIEDSKKFNELRCNEV